MGWGRQQQPQGSPQGQPWTPSQQAPEPAVARGPVWEYKVLESPLAVMLEQTLNNLGSEGWELVAVDSDPKHKVAKGNLYLFKRPKV